jgi:hypothetical protein
MRTLLSKEKEHATILCTTSEIGERRVAKDRGLERSNGFSSAPPSQVDTLSYSEAAC